MNLETAQETTILGMVNEIFAKGEFVCPINKGIVEEKEKIISELTDYEKAILLARDKASDEVKNLIKKMTEEGKEKSPFSLLSGILGSEKTSEDSSFLNKLLWDSIERRLSREGKGSYIHLSLKKDWQIAAIIEVDEEERDCEKCDKKDHCPIKGFRAIMAEA